MVEWTQRCGVCRCYLDEEDLFCANCGTESPWSHGQTERLDNEADHYSFECKSCGASMSYDASSQALRCPFCGSTSMERQATVRSVKPDGVVPFSIDQQRAEGVLRNWLRTGFWTPSDAARASRVGEMTAVYVPYWIFEAETDTRWTADSSPPPPGSRGDWYPLGGSHQSRYRGILVAGSSILSLQETDAIAPFDLSDAVQSQEVDLKNAIYEQFRVPRKLARPVARAAIEELEREASARKVPNRSRNIRVNVRISSMRGYPMLLPVWILAYRYKKEVHRVLINGQTGKIAGTSPFSYAKLSVLVMIVLVFLAVVFAIAMLSNM